MTPSASLQTILEHASSVKLAFLNARLAGVSTGHSPLQSVAGRLLQAGLPAVIAMQAEIRR